MESLLNKNTIILFVLVFFLFSTNILAIEFPHIQNSEVCITKYSLEVYAFSKSKGKVSIHCIDDKNKLSEYSIPSDVKLGTSMFGELFILKGMTLSNKFSLDGCYSRKEEAGVHYCYFTK